MINLLTPFDTAKIAAAYNTFVCESTDDANDISTGYDDREDELKDGMSERGYDYNEWDSNDNYIVFDSDSGRISFNSWDEVAEWLNGNVEDEGDIELDPNEVSDIKETLDSRGIWYNQRADGTIDFGIGASPKGKWNSWYDALRYIEKNPHESVANPETDAIDKDEKINEN